MMGRDSLFLLKVKGRKKNEKMDCTLEVETAR